MCARGTALGSLAGRLASARGGFRRALSAFVAPGLDRPRPHPRVHASVSWASVVEMARETSAPPPEGDGEGADETEEARRARVRRRLKGSWREPETGPRPKRAPSPSPAEETDFYAVDPSVGFAGATERLRDAWARKKVNRTRLRAKALASGAPEARASLEDPLDPSTWYREFRRQQFAFDWGDAREAAFREARRSERPAAVPRPEPPKMRYFSLERHGDGRRAFVAASLEAFWARYESLPVDHRHHYELIRADTPCRLYYDLEFSTETNPDADGERAVDALARLTLERLANEHGVGVESNGSIEPFDPRDVVVDLKSTTSEEARKKFSRHLVFRLPGVAFASAAHCGEFVRRLHADASSRRGSDADCDAVFVRGENALADAPRDVSFVDLGVYTRNRAFRLYLSSKHGKTHRMLQPPASRFFRASAGEATRPCLETFKACLVSEPADLIGADEGEGTSDGGERRPGVSRGKTRLLEYPGVGASGPYGFGKRHDCGGSAVLSGYGLGGVEPKQRAPSVSSFAADETCPVRLTAAFVCADFDAWSPAGCSGASVRAWTASPGLGVATLHMQGNRFCENTERAHKSNNVSFTVDFREGAYYQRCHDPDCRGFRGCFRPLPDALLAEAVAFCQLARGANGGDAARKEDNVAGARGRWSPPRIGSDDGDDAFFLAAAKAASPSRPRESGWTPPRFGDEEDDEAFWNRAAALACER